MKDLKDDSFQITFKFKNIKRSTHKNNFGQYTYYGDLYVGSTKMDSLAYQGSNFDTALTLFKAEIWMAIIRKFRKK